MNKKICSIMLILCTIFTVCCMLYYNQKGTGKYPPLAPALQESNENSKGNLNNEGQKSLVENSIYKPIDSYRSHKPYIAYGSFIDYKRDTIHKLQLKDMQEYYDWKTGAINVKANVEDQVALQGEQTEEKSTAVFKPSQPLLKRKLLTEDKEKILSAAEVLSPIDYARIKEYLKEENEEKGVQEAVYLLRDRLSDKEFEGVEETLQAFVNLDVLTSGE